MKSRVHSKFDAD